MNHMTYIGCTQWAQGKEQRLATQEFLPLNPLFKVARAGTALLTMTPRAVLPFQDRNFQTPKLSRGYKCWTQEHKNVDCRMHACIVKKLIGSIENLFYCFERLASVTSDRTALCGWNCDVQFPIRKTLSEWLRDPKKLLGCGFHG